MTTEERPNPRILGRLSSADGAGVVHMEDSFDTDIIDLWSALTDTQRLSRWLCEVRGEPRLGTEFRVRFLGSGYEGWARVEACEAPKRFQVRTKDEGLPYEIVTEVVLTSQGDRTHLVAEERGMPVDKLAAYGAGIQIEVESLGDYLAGREGSDASGRWQELIPAYETLAAKVDD